MKFETWMNFEGFRSTVRSSIRDRMTRTVRALATEAKRLCPIRTGALKKSIVWEVSSDGRTGWYGSNRPWRGEASLPYAVFQEIGFRHWRSGEFIPGKAYLRGALQTKKETLRKIWGGYRLHVTGEFEVPRE